MKATMMDHPLSTQMIVDRGERLFGTSRVVSFDGTTTQVRSFAETASRARRLAGALAALGVPHGEPVATYCWNSPAHLEAYLAVPAMGAVLHTLNVRLPADQIRYIMGHAADRALIVDAVLLPAIAAILPECPAVDHVIVVGEAPEEIAGFAGQIHVYEHLIAAAAPMTVWPRLVETDAAAICYTSGTTGLPKGVVYSHRSVYLHSLASMAADTFAISNRDRILMVPPMFHANAWGMPYSGWLAGSDLILPGPHLQSGHLARLIAEERPSLMAAVPTILNDLLQAHAQAPLDLSSFRTIVSGGSAVSANLIERVKAAWGVDVVQGWGMTETSPMCVLSFPPREVGPEGEVPWRAKAGRPVPGMHVRIVDDQDRPLPEDGTAMGHLQLQGPWVTGGYLKERPEDSRLTADGWLRTGDVGRIDALGYVEITDRAKDLIKSGGEWISSTDLENGIAGLPGVVEAAVFAIPDPRWEERPLAVVAVRDSADFDPMALRAGLREGFARFMIPEYWARTDSIPKTSVGKFDKKSLREKFDAGEMVVVVETGFTPGD
ncbi:long-chain-fatty-acid--CoA ligase [Novosphingobium sp. AAP93]|uniref:long-chain-fatty-acid--CoA ligase n=1 Tax=Novosphingobium sp. AAP93 TaxID=1523427 RepID=UPI0006B9EA20|nr:long-chain-fatty-acid--CoA ligase [Novosphingobium sp. AAP93]KPF85201.1 long-chain fatty acid--CoA ligase [Novosphingobium sp. AAP93]